MAIDIGAAAIDRGTYRSSGETLIDKSNPANASGTITSVEIWAMSIDLANCEVAIFEEVSPNYFTTRSNVAIGTVTKGSKQTFPVELAVEAGDFIGIYFTSGFIEADSSGGVEVRYSSGDWIPCTNHLFLLAYSGYQISLYGEGDLVPPVAGRSFGIIIG